MTRTTEEDEGDEDDDDRRRRRRRTTTTTTTTTMTTTTMTRTTVTTTKTLGRQRPRRGNRARPEDEDETKRSRCRGLRATGTRPCVTQETRRSRGDRAPSSTAQHPRLEPHTSTRETLRQFFDRTKMHWTTLVVSAATSSAEEDSRKQPTHSEKELKRIGFLASARFEELLPVLERLNELEAEQRSLKQGTQLLHARRGRDVRARCATDAPGSWRRWGAGRVGAAAMAMLSRCPPLVLGRRASFGRRRRTASS